MNESHVVTLVGGYVSMAANFELHLAEWGIEVTQHFEYLPLRVPTRSTMLIVLKSACSHKLFDAAQLVATKRQIPVVVVDHHWTQAEEVLRRSGVLDTAGPPAVDLSRGYWAETRVAELDREVARLRNNLSQAENLILEQQELLDRLSLVIQQQQKSLESLAETVGDPRRSMTLVELRRYATYEVGLTGASKVRGGKTALLQAIQQVGSNLAACP